MASKYSHALMAVEQRGVKTATAERVIRMERVVESPTERAVVNLEWQREHWGILRFLTWRAFGRFAPVRRCWRLSGPPQGRSMQRQSLMSSSAARQLAGRESGARGGVGGA